MRAQELKQTHKRKPLKTPEHTLEHLSRRAIFWGEHILSQGGWASANQKGPQSLVLLWVPQIL